MNSGDFKRLARHCGFELAGAALAKPSTDYPRYTEWIEAGMGAEMAYLSGWRSEVRANPRLLLESARTVLCLGKLYNTPRPYSTQFSGSDLGWISRYAWGDDYHDLLRRDLKRLVSELPVGEDYKICTDTSPLLERSYARLAGLGWIGKNTCLINQPLGSWFFLGEILTSLELEPDGVAPDRCGTCRRCIDACPTQAISPGGYQLDSRLCISYFTIELRGPVPEQHRAAIGANLFGCDICQDVCPWNRRAPVTAEQAFAPRMEAPPLEAMAALGEDEFRQLFRGSPVRRAKYTGFLRNVAIAMGNSRQAKFREPLERLARHPDGLVRQHACWAIRMLG